MAVVSAPNWDSKYELDQYCQHEIRFWKNNLTKRNVRKCFNFKQPNCFVYSDASNTGCASVITMNKELVCHRTWTENESSKSSTWRELEAINFALVSFKKILNGSYVKWYTDNQAAAKIIEVGSMKLELHNIAINHS